MGRGNETNETGERDDGNRNCGCAQIQYYRYQLYTHTHTHVRVYQQQLKRGIRLRITSAEQHRQSRRLLSYAMHMSSRPEREKRFFDRSDMEFSYLSCEMPTQTNGGMSEGRKEVRQRVEEDSSLSECKSHTPLTRSAYE